MTPFIVASKSLHRQCIGPPSSFLKSALQFDYSIYRTVVGYYSGEEDAYDMRKAMSRDIHKRSLKARKDRIHPDELETD